MYTSYALAKARQQELTANATACQLATQARKARARRRQRDAMGRAGFLAVLRPRRASP